MTGTPRKKLEDVLEEWAHVVKYYGRNVVHVAEHLDMTPSALDSALHRAARKGLPNTEHQCPRNKR